MPEGATIYRTAGQAWFWDTEITALEVEVAEVLGGLQAGQRVILHPGEKVKAGVKVDSAS